MISLINCIKRHWIVITLLSFGAITTLSLWPMAAMPAVPGSDKTHHLMAYAVLMFPAALRKPKHWKSIGLFFVAYSGLIELFQPYLNRYGDWLDVAANTAGVICGLLAAKVILFFSSPRVSVDSE